MTIGKNIAALRKEAGLTQAQLGERLGVSNQAISKWEKGMNLPDVMLLPQIAKVFDVTIDRLFEGVDDEPNEEASDERLIWLLREEYDAATLIVRYPVEAVARMMQVQVEASGVHLSAKQRKEFNERIKTLHQHGTLVDKGPDMTMEVVRYED